MVAVALQVEGIDICTIGDFQELLDGMDHAGPTLGVLQAWFLGEPATAEQVHEALDIEARLKARDEATIELIDRMLDRIEELFPAQLAQFQRPSSAM